MANLPKSDIVSEIIASLPKVLELRAAADVGLSEGAVHNVIKECSDLAKLPKVNKLRAEDVGLSRPKIASLIKEMSEMARLPKLTKLHADFEERIFDLWLACWTQEEIAEDVGLAQQKVSEKVSHFLADLPKGVKLRADFEDDGFEAPLLPPATRHTCHALEAVA